MHAQSVCMHVCVYGGSMCMFIVPLVVACSLPSNKTGWLGHKVIKSSKNKWTKTLKKNTENLRKNKTKKKEIKRKEIIFELLYEY